MNERDFDVEDAYVAKTPTENRDLYERWADTYESGFINNRGYVYHERVAQIFVEHGGQSPVLDVGCGTGIVGEALATLGVGTIDGIDITPAMLTQADTKRTAQGGPVYRDLIEGDLTDTLSIATGAYTGVISVGTFTLGHVGPEALDELFRVGSSGATYALGINRAHFTERGFKTKLDAAVQADLISPYDLDEIRMYEVDADEFSADTAFVARFSRTATPA